MIAFMKRVYVIYSNQFAVMCVFPDIIRKSTDGKYTNQWIPLVFTKIDFGKLYYRYLLKKQILDELISQSFRKPLKCFQEFLLQAASGFLLYRRADSCVLIKAGHPCQKVALARHRGFLQSAQLSLVRENICCFQCY